jgi:hypothetical protein
MPREDGCIVASSLTRIGDLDINQDLPFQQRSWTAQRIGWAAMALLVLAALIGVFGQGPLSRAVAHDPTALFRVEFERFARYQTTFPLRVHFTHEAARNGALSMWISREYLNHVRIKTIMPEPTTTRLSSDGLTYLFAFHEPGPDGEVFLYVEAQDVGLLSGRIGLTADHSIPFKQLVYP